MRVIVSGGGTGGHIYPALSIIHEIKKQEPNSEFLYIGTQKGLEYEIVKKEGIPFQSIEITGFKRSLSVENIKTIRRFFQANKKSKQLIRDFKPDVVIGTGGYVCGPVVYAAAKLKIPTFIHEQNSVPGLTNKFLSKYVDRIFVQFEESKKAFPKEKTMVVGNPRAGEVVGASGERGRESLGIKKEKDIALIVGGSRGARPINEAVFRMLHDLKEREYHVVYVTGSVHFKQVQEEIKKIKDLNNVTVLPFIHNMQEVLNSVHLIISRAGATTLAEITALGIPAILIPSPYVTNNHQEKNARALEKHHAAIVVLEQELTNKSLLEKMDDIMLNKAVWEKMHEASLQLGKQDAGYEMYKVMHEYTASK